MRCVQGKPFLFPIEPEQLIPMEYYLQKEEDASVFGPTDIELLQHWASEGRIAPGDGLSTDNANWTPAVDHPELHMEWLIELDDGGTYGPIHIMALRHMLREGQIATDAVVVHRTSGERHEAGTALLHLLIADNDHLQQDLQTLSGVPKGPAASKNNFTQTRFLQLTGSRINL